jgi:hypothetical protein
MLETETGKTTSHAVENSLRRRLWSFHMTDYRKNETTKPDTKYRKPATSPPFNLISCDNSCQEILSYSVSTAIIINTQKLLPLKWIGISGNLLAQN